MSTNRRLLLGDVPLFEDNGGTGHLGLLYYCPTCGNGWAKLERSHGWVAVPALCPAHGTFSRVGGSFFNDVAADPRDAYEFQEGNREPEATTEGSLGRFLLKHPALLAHEFAMHLAHHERQQPETSHD